MLTSETQSQLSLVSIMYTSYGATIHDFTRIALKMDINGHHQDLLWKIFPHILK